MNQQKRNSIILFSLLAIASLSIYYLLDLDFFLKWKVYKPLLKKLSLSLSLVFIILLAGKIIENFIHRQAHTEGDRYNLLRITKLISIIMVTIVTASFLFQNLYATVLSFGLISLVLGFALQAPITSFIAWLYIVFKRPYKVGHRIQINGMRGDVVEINYLDTKILECSGDYLQNDRKSGRVIHFPNSMILKDQVINYSGPQSPFIWNETAIQIAYTSDLNFVKTCLIEATVQDFGEKYPKYDVKVRKRWAPEVYFRINQYAWLEAVVSYPVEPRDTTGRRTRILLKALPQLNQFPDKVQFPEGSQR
ncbi:MAG TPA: mechanosensitive ion channel domain-containing protein [Moheibacter sp.]|nr:mechanosensitive ion channel domain-containing protein [Moheibacter sp.]